MIDSKLADSAFPIDVGGQQLLCSMLADRDYGDLQEWAQSRFIKMATDASKNYSTEVKREVIAVALKEALKISWGSSECDSLIWSPDGMKQLCFVMIRKRHPRLTLEQIVKLVEIDPTEAYEAIFLAFQKLNFSHIEEASGGASAENTKSTPNEG